MATGENVRTRLRALYGEGGDAVRGGFRVLHVVAAWRAPDSSLRVIRIGPTSPRSETDSFVLRAARMRSDAIVTTGKILRAEPALTHDEFDPELLAWRRDSLMRPVPPLTVILSSGLSLAFDHPLLGRVPAPLLVVPKANLGRVAAAAEASTAEPEVAGRDDASLRDVLTLLRERGASQVLIEAGPTTARDLYREPIAVDELWLSVFEEPTLAAECVGEPFADADTLNSIFSGRSKAATRTELSGRWTFQRLWR